MILPYLPFQKIIVELSIALNASSGPVKTMSNYDHARNKHVMFNNLMTTLNLYF